MYFRAFWYYIVYKQRRAHSARLPACVKTSWTATIYTIIILTIAIEKILRELRKLDQQSSKDVQNLSKNTHFCSVFDQYRSTFIKCSIHNHHFDDCNWKDITWSGKKRSKMWYFCGVFVHVFTSIYTAHPISLRPPPPPYNEAVRRRLQLKLKPMKYNIIVSNREVSIVIPFAAKLRGKIPRRSRQKT